MHALLLFLLETINLQMRKFILEALKVKFPGVSDTILGRIAAKIAKTAKTEDEATAAMEGVTFQYVIDSERDYHVNKTKERFEKQDESKDDQPATGTEGADKSSTTAKTTTQGDGQQGNEHVPAYMREFMEKVSTELAAIKGEKTTNTRKTRLSELLKDAPETIRQRYEKDFTRMNFKDDDDFEEWIGEIAPDVEKISTEFTSKGGIVSRPKSGGTPASGNEPNPYLAARIAEREAAPATPAIQGLPTNK